MVRSVRDRVARRWPQKAEWLEPMVRSAEELGRHYLQSTRIGTGAQ
jgi:hypothetical protein